jgi:rod shape-determining protein MreD
MATIQRQQSQRSAGSEMAFPDPLDAKHANPPGWLPVAVLTSLAMLSAIPIPAGHGPLPDIVLIGVYLASSRRPASVSPGFVFCLGLLQDLLSSTPFGLHAFVYVLVHAASSYTPGLSRSVLLHWLGFLPPALIAAAAGWMVISVHHASFVSFQPMLARTAASILAFPLIVVPFHWLTGKLHNEQ